MEFHDENEEDVQGRERDERDEEEVEEEENEEGDIMYEHDDRDYEDDEERGSENNVEDEIEHYSPQIYEDEEDDDERFHQTDKNIINVLKVTSSSFFILTLNLFAEIGRDQYRMR